VEKLSALQKAAPQKTSKERACILLRIERVEKLPAFAESGSAKNALYG
jgi:hypothetical protein